MFPGRVLCLIISSSLILAGFAMGSEINLEAEKAKVSEVIHNSIGWALNKDKDLLYSCFAQDSGFFIYNPDNAGNIIGFEAFRSHAESFFMHPDFKATGFEVRDLRIGLSKSGEAAWYSCFLDDFGEWKGRPTSWINARWTGVLEKRDGRWVIVQMHFSFGTDDLKEKAEKEKAGGGQ